MQAALALAARELRRERVEALIPEAPEGFDPVVDLAERRGADRVQPARALGPDVRETAIAQDPKVLRHRRLRDPELRLDDRRDRPRCQLPGSEQLEDPATDRVSENIERVHGSQDRIITLYKSILMFGRVDVVDPTA